MKIWLPVWLLLWSVVAAFGQSQSGDLTVLDPATAGEQFEAYLKREFYQLCDQRSDAINALESVDDCRNWQQSRIDFFLNRIDLFPERTPLNARTVGKLDGDGYRVEKVLFESRPNHHVTGALYLPLGEGPFPGVLVPCGHSHTGKAAGHYQRVSILLAKHGMAALCYDPIGQGERYQMLDYEKDHTHFDWFSSKVPSPHPRVKHLCTEEHTTMGMGCILLGTNIAQFRIWDGMRAIDYLQSRDDIIDNKIGCTGISGGGTLTSYLMALDLRIVAAAPGCFPMTYRRLIETKGPQDAEQSIFGQIAFGMDQADYFNVRAPAPRLILGATRDATFDITGTWDLFRDAKRFYTRMGYPQRIAMVEADVLHGFDYPLREAATQWMQRWLLGVDDVVREFDDPPGSVIDDEEMLRRREGDWTPEELWCTPEGLTMLMPDEKSVFEINVETEESWRTARRSKWQKLTPEGRRSEVRELIGKPAVAESAEFEVVGKIDRDGYSIEKVVLRPEAGIELPALVFLPDQPADEDEIILHLSGAGMKAEAESGGQLEKWVTEDRRIVISAELRGIGETRSGLKVQDWARGRFGADVREFFIAYLMGRSFVGMRTGDVEAWAKFAESYHSENQTKYSIRLIAQGESAIPALHAAALLPDAFSQIELRDMLKSWSELLGENSDGKSLSSVVHDALQHYDLPDLIEMIGADRVRLYDPEQ